MAPYAASPSASTRGRSPVGVLDSRRLSQTATEVFHVAIKRARNGFGVAVIGLVLDLVPVRPAFGGLIGGGHSARITSGRLKAPTRVHVPCITFRRR